MYYEDTTVNIQQIKEMFENWQCAVMGRRYPNFILRVKYPWYNWVMQVAEKSYDSSDIWCQVMAPWSYQLELIERQKYYNEQQN